MKLLEIFNMISEAILLENRLAHLKTTFGQKLALKYLNDNGSNADGVDLEPVIEELFNKIAEADPSPQKKFTQWLITLYLKNGMTLNELPQATELIKNFIEYGKQIPADKRNIASYKTLQDLSDMLEPIMAQGKEISGKEKERRLGMEMHKPEHSETIYNSPTIKVVIPKTKEASIYFGRNTKWCTSGTEYTNSFRTYNRQGKLYIALLKKAGHAFQIHFATNECKNELNIDVPFPSVISEYPEIKEALDEYMSTFDTTDNILLDNPSISISLAVKTQVDATNYDLMSRGEYISDDSDNNEKTPLYIVTTKSDGLTHTMHFESMSADDTIKDKKIYNTYPELRQAMIEMLISTDKIKALHDSSSSQIIMAPSKDATKFLLSHTDALVGPKFKTIPTTPTYLVTNKSDNVSTMLSFSTINLSVFDHTEGFLNHNPEIKSFFEENPQW